MISNRQTWFRRICIIVILLAIALTPFGGISDLRAQDNETPQLAPLNPDFLEFWQNPPPEPFYGYIPPPMDLSHLDKIPVERARGAATLPSTFDWRTQGKVTSVKNQNPCGTCWIFGTTSVLESAVLIGENTIYDFSEQSVSLCVDRSWVSRYDDPTDPCMAGGWSWLASEVFIKKGAVLESCKPYNPSGLNCDGTCVCDSCTPVKKVTGYRMIANEATSPEVIEPIKNAIYNHGPLAMSYRMDTVGPPYPHMYPGNIYYWSDCNLSTNHLVSIVGWDDTIAHPAGGGSGAWIVKNSWGTDFGAGGYFYLCYGSASMDEVASLEYKDYNPNEKLYYWDEAGLVDSGFFGNWDDYSGWMASIFTSSQNGSLTHVDFWTTSNNAQYQIQVYLDGNISDGLTNLATSQSGTCQEFGYYSIPLASPVSLTNGQPFTIAVRMTTPSFKYPIPIEFEWIQGGQTIANPPIQTGKTFFRHLDGESWTDTASQGCNACLRGRVTTGAVAQPDITVSPPSFNVTLPPNTTQTYGLTIGNVGGATLTYSITDRVTTGGSNSAGEKNLLLTPASEVLEIPLEGNVLEPEEARASGWQNIMTDGFEGTFPGTKWQLFGNPTWGKESYRHHTGSYSIWCAGSSYNPPANYPNDMAAWMVYGPFSLADATDAELNFYLWLKSEYEYDYLWWTASTNGSNFYGWQYSGDSGGWVSKSFDLTSVYSLGNLCGQPQVWIAFIFESDEAGTDKGAFVDNVVLRKYVGTPNNPPNQPSNPSPANHVTGVSVNADLSWTGGDPDAGDTVTYDVYFDTTGATTLVSNDQSATTYDPPGNLNNNTKYYWKIVATDNHGASTTGALWDFTTIADCPWLDENPKSGSIAPGGSNNVAVIINTTGLALGSYYAEIVIANNDADENPTKVPVTLHVSKMVLWNCPLGGQALIAPYPAAGRPFLTVAVACSGITASAGAQLWGIYYLDETTGTWFYYIPGFASSTLTQLEPGKYYYVVVSGACTLQIPQG